MRYGRTVPSGSLPVYSVGSEAEAQRLLTMACPTNIKHEYIATELAKEQTVENLWRFSDRLEKYHELLVQHGQCDCSKEKR